MKCQGCSMWTRSIPEVSEDSDPAAMLCDRCYEELVLMQGPVDLATEAEPMKALEELEHLKWANALMLEALEAVVLLSQNQGRLNLIEMAGLAREAIAAAKGVKLT